MGVNTVPISAGEALDVLRGGWRDQAAGRMTLSWMLHGRPGIGKTEIVQTLARETSATLHDLRLTTIEPQDLRGLPYYDHATARTVWYRPEDLPDEVDKPSILFLDELTSASPFLQPTVYGLLQERRVGRHVLPHNTFLVAAGNGVEDGALAYDLGTALSDRLVHLSLRAETEDWIRSFAVPNRLHPAVIAFLRTRPDLLETTEDALTRGLTIACTPRSWARVSAILMSTEDRRRREIMVSGTVGEAAAAEFMLIVEDIAATVQVAEMVEAAPKDRIAMYPQTMHGLSALVFGLVGFADVRTLPAAIEIMVQITELPRLRSEAVFARLPLAELRSYGFEMLISRSLDLGLGETFRNSAAYAGYADERRAAGLA